MHDCVHPESAYLVCLPGLLVRMRLVAAAAVGLEVQASLCFLVLEDAITRTCSAEVALHTLLCMHYW